MKKTALLYLLAGLLLAAPSYAQAPAQGGGDDTEESQDDDDEKSKAKETEDNKRFWQASLAGGHYMVAIDHIASISMHEYALDGGLIVNEVVVDTNGRSLVRFYHVVTVAENAASGTARRVVERGHDLLDRAGQKAGTDVKDMVQKSYPVTSHAGMVEFRVENLSDLDAIYKSVKNAWETGKGRRITVK